MPDSKRWARQGCVLALLFWAIQAEAQNAATSVSDLPARSVYVSQVGTANRARVEQASPAAAASIEQQGNDNQATVYQRASVAAAEIIQLGVANSADVWQDGSGSSYLSLRQNGGDNHFTGRQTTTGAGLNDAVVQQQGSGNTIALLQAGSDNEANLKQIGNGNAMDLMQTGVRNQMAWTQSGSELARISVEQTGSQALVIHQANGR